MFVRNAWYCAGWNHEVTQGRDSIVARQIAGERVVLYRKPSGEMVAMEDRCPHRQAALSRGRKEGDALRCMYHGMKFGADGQCTEIPGQSTIPERACVRVFPVVEKDDWIWVWMGDAAKADPNLICFAVGPSHPDWVMRTSKMRVDCNYRLEIANLSDLSHLAWVHENTVGGSRKYPEAKPQHTITPRGMNTFFWVRQVPPTAAVKHLFPEGTLFDLRFEIQMSVPCNWIMHFTIHLAGKNTEGDSDGALVADTYTCQAVTPRDADSVDYYYSWGASKATEFPGLSDMLRDTLNVAFREDADVLEAQHIRAKERPQFKGVDIALDAGPGKMLWVLDKLIREEESGQRAAVAA